MMSANTDQAAAVVNRVTTAVVVDGSGDGGYAMLEPTELSAEGGFLGGKLFFEVNEQFTLRISRGDADPVRVRVRVVELERGDEPGMWVEFVDLADGERERISDLIAAK